MEYLNAADVLPKKLLKELSTYVNGQLLYVPSTENKNHGEVKAVQGSIMNRGIAVLWNCIKKIQVLTSFANNLIYPMIRFVK